MSEREEALEGAILQTLRHSDADTYRNVLSAKLSESFDGLSRVRKYTVVIKTAKKREFFRVRLYEGADAEKRAKEERIFWRKARNSESSSIYPIVVAPDFQPPLPILLYRDVKADNPDQEPQPLFQRVHELAEAVRLRVQPLGAEQSGDYARSVEKALESTREWRAAFIKEVRRFAKLHAQFCRGHVHRKVPFADLVTAAIEKQLPDFTLKTTDATWQVTSIKINGKETRSLLGLLPEALAMPLGAAELSATELNGLVDSGRLGEGSAFRGLACRWRRLTPVYTTRQDRIEFSLPGNRSLWIWAPSGELSQETLEDVTAIVLDHGLLKSLRSIQDALAEAKFQQPIVLKKVLDAYRGNGLTCLDMACHGDFHAKNILAIGDRLIAIDLGVSESGNAADDLARLELSLWADLGTSYSEDYDASSARRVLSACESNHSEDLNPGEKVLFEVIRAFREAFTAVALDDNDLKQHEWRAQHALAAVSAAEEYQSYYLSRTHVPAPASLAGAIGYWSDHAKTVFSSAGKSPGPSPIVEPYQPHTVGELLALSLSRKPGESELHLRAEARELFNDIASRGDSLLSRKLNPLPQAVRDLCRSGNSPFDQDERHTLIAAPTGAGKSFLAELFLLRGAFIDEGPNDGKAVYISPTRALAQEKYRDMMDRVSDRYRKTIILSTGDDRGSDGRLVAGGFKIAFTVYEKASMLLSRSSHLLSKLQCIVVDELHMLDELHRGPVLDLVLSKVIDARRQPAQIYDRDDLSPRLRVIALTTEGTVQDGMKEYLSTISEDNDTPLPPIVISSPTRPVPVEHSVVIPGAKPASYQCVAIKRIETARDRILSPNEEAELEERLHALSHEAGQSRSDLNSEKKQQAEAERILMACLADRVRERVADGYRALVFLPGIGKLESAAVKFAKHKYAPINDNAAAAMKAAIPPGQADNQRTSQLSIELARNGAFLHHSDIDREIRNFIEQRFRKPASLNTAEVIFCTETLSYGVNLAVDEVFLAGVRFPNADRALTDVEPTRLTPCEYHNMAGRAGRIGVYPDGVPPEFCVFTIAKPDLMPYRQIIKPFYTKEGEIVGRLFETDDGEAQKRLQRLAEGDLPFVGHAEEFSPPFIRSVIDVVRHLGYLNRGIGDRRAGSVSAEDILNFIDITYGSIDLKVRRPQFAKLLPVAVDSILQDLAIDADQTRGKTLQVQLLERTVVDLSAYADDLGESFTRPLAASESNRRVRVRYRITELGETLIDTGSDLRTVRPLQRLLPKLDACWRGCFRNSQMPPEFIILAACAQRDAVGKVYKSTPEYNNSGVGFGERWPEVLIEKNRLQIDRSFATYATRGLSLNPISAKELTEQIRGLLREWVRSSLYDDKWSLDHDLTVDVILRLATGLSAWVNGEPREQVFRLLEKSDAQPRSQRRFKGWQSYVEQLQYKVTFVAKVMASIDRQTGGATSGRIARSRRLFIMAERVRYGCEAIALPLAAVRLPSERKVNRDAKNALIAGGITPQRIVSESAQKLSKQIGINEARQERWIDVDQLESLRNRLIDYYGGQAENLYNQWITGWTDREEHGDWISDSWRLLAKKFGAATNNYFHSKGSDPIDEEIRRGVVGWRFAPSPDANAAGTRDADGDEETVATRGEVFVQTSPGNGGGFIAAYRHPDSNDAHETRFIFRSLNSEGQLCDKGGAWQSFAETLASYRNDNLAIVCLPWIPLLDERGKYGKYIDEEIMRRKKRGFSTCFVTSNAWGVAFTAMGRGLLEPDAFARLWRSPKASRVTIESVITTLEEKSELALGIPETLWEAIFTIQEVS